MSGVHLCILVTEVLIKCIVGVPSTTSLYTEDVPLRVLKKAGFPSTTSLYTEDVPLRVLKKAGFPSSLVSFTQMVIQFFLRFPRSIPPPPDASHKLAVALCAGGGY